MSTEQFLITIYCLVDDEMKAIEKDRKLRHGGFEPKLSDSEVITMEVVGEFLGIDTDKGIHQYFRQHWHHFFPAIGVRTTFVRQAANLWSCKERIRLSFFKKLYPNGCSVNVIDGLPMPVCGFSRAYFSKIFKDVSAYGYCAAKKMRYYGLKGHLLMTKDGVIAGFSVAAANIDEREMMFELGIPKNSILLGDKGYILSSMFKFEIESMNINLQTPLRSNMKDERPKLLVGMICRMRRIVETVIGQLSDRLHIEKVRARDCWHLTARTFRKLLVHTLACFMCRDSEHSILQFDSLLT